MLLRNCTSNAGSTVGVMKHPSAAHSVGNFKHTHDEIKDGTQQLLPHSERSLEAGNTKRKQGRIIFEDLVKDNR